MADRNSLSRLPTGLPTFGRALAALLGLWWLPALVVADALAAERAGWLPGLTWRVFGAAVIVCCLATFISLMSSRARRLYGRHTSRLWTLSIASLLALVGVELALRQFTVDRLFPRRKAGHVYEFEPDVALFPGAAPIAHQAINSRGWRGTECPDDEATYRILCLGGATTECLYIDDPHTWPAQLMQNLSAGGTVHCWVGNAGLSGDGVAQHWNRLRHGDPARQMDCVLLLLGGDDLLRAILRVDDHPAPRLAQRLLCLQVLLGRAEPSPTQLADHTGVDLSAARNALNTQVKDLDLGPPLERFTAYIRQLAYRFRQQNRRLVFVTQPVLWDDLLPSLGTRRLHLMRSYLEPGAAELQPPKLDQIAALALSDHFNQRLTKACRELDVECFDAARRMNGRTHYFYDDLHLNDAGCKELARLLTEYLRDHPDRRWASLTAGQSPPPLPADALPPVPER